MFSEVKDLHLIIVFLFVYLFFLDQTEDLTGIFH